MSETKKSKRRKRFVLYGFIIFIWFSLGFYGLTADPQTEHTIIEMDYEPPEDDVAIFEDLPPATQDNFRTAIQYQDNSLSTDPPTTREKLPNDGFIQKDNKIYHIRTEKTLTTGSALAIMLALVFIPAMIMSCWVAGAGEMDEIDETDQQ